MRVDMKKYLKKILNITVYKGIVKLKCIGVFNAKRI